MAKNIRVAMLVDAVVDHSLTDILLSALLECIAIAFAPYSEPFGESVCQRLENAGIHREQ